jgi:hypothetical protein
VRFPRPPRIGTAGTLLAHWMFAMQRTATAKEVAVEAKEESTQPFATRVRLERASSAERIPSATSRDQDPRSGVHAAIDQSTATPCSAGGWRRLFPYGVSRHAGRIYSPS